MKINRYIIVMVLVSSSYQDMCAAKKWNSAKVFDITDKNLILENNIKLPIGATRIEAATKDVSVTLDKSVVVESNRKAYTKLHLIPGADQNNQNITINVNKDLTFKSKTNKHNFTIEVGKSNSFNSAASCGNVSWIIEKKLSFLPKS